MQAMKEVLDRTFITAEGKAEFFDIEDIDGNYRAKINVPAQDDGEINNMIHYCNHAWDSEKQIYLGYHDPKDDLSRKIRITNITKAEDALTPMMTLTVILPQADYQAISCPAA